MDDGSHHFCSHHPGGRLCSGRCHPRNVASAAHGIPRFRDRGDNPSEPLAAAALFATRALASLMAMAGPEL
jgi:hypothetical protein